MQMHKGFQKKQNGSITIEASLSLFLFIGLFIGIILLINISRAQAVIGTTINKSALEMSQYAYYYKASGLYDLEADIQGKGSEAKTLATDAYKNADNAIAGVEAIYSALGGAKGHVAGAADGTTSIPDAIGGLKDSYDNVSSNMSEVAKAMDELGNQASGIINNPVDFAKALLALGASSAGDAMKSRLIAAPLAKAMCINHLKVKSGDRGVDSYLKSLGIVDGTNGLNFNMSTLFHSDSHSDINLIVVYKVKVLTLLGKDFNITFAQSASTRGWLGDSKSRNPAVGGSNSGGGTPATDSGTPGGSGEVPTTENGTPGGSGENPAAGNGIIAGGGTPSGSGETTAAGSGTPNESSTYPEETSKTEPSNENGGIIIPESSSKPEEESSGTATSESGFIWNEESTLTKRQQERIYEFFGRNADEIIKEGLADEKILKAVLNSIKQGGGHLFEAETIKMLFDNGIPINEHSTFINNKTVGRVGEIDIGMDDFIIECYSGTGSGKSEYDFKKYFEGHDFYEDMNPQGRTVVLYCPNITNMPDIDKIKALGVIVITEESELIKLLKR